MDHRSKSRRRKVPDNRTRKKVKDPPKSFIKDLSEAIGERSWQDLGLRLGFTRSQIAQLETSYKDDHSFCAQIMLKDWQNIAKEFIEQPETHICVLLRKMGLEALVPSYLSKIDVSLDSHFHKAEIIRAIQDISFGPTAALTGPLPANVPLHISSCSNVIIGTTNTITDKSVHLHTASTEVAALNELEEKAESPEDKIVRSLELIIKRHPSKTHGMNLQKLETEFQNELRSQNVAKQTFYNFAGKKLLQFLREHNDRFEIHLDGSKYFIKTFIKSVIPKMSPMNPPPSCTHEQKAPDSTLAQNVCFESDSDDDVDIKTENRSDECQVDMNEKKVSEMKSYAAAVGSHDKTLCSTAVSRQSPSHSCNISRSSDLNDVKDIHTDPRDFLDFVKNFAGGHYILLVCFKQKMKYLDCLGLVPWLAVFDFDDESRSSGLLSVLEERIKKMRAIYTCTWKDTAKFTDYCTEWCLIRGSIQEAASKTPKECRDWFRTVKAKLGHHFEMMAAFTETYSTVKCIIILPEDEETLKCMLKTVSKLEEYIEPPPTIIVCDPQMQQHSSSADWIYKAMHVDFKLRCNFQEFCKALSHTSLVDDLKQMKTPYKLPTSDDTNNPGFDEAFVSNLRENLEVLYLDYPRSRPIDLDVLKEEGVNFLKGGTLRWFAYYECNAGHFDAERDIMDSIVKRIKEKFLDPFRSGVIKLYHAPGSGGTTLMQRVLWELRKLSPCAQVKIHPTISVQDLAHDLESLFEKTHLPLVLLVDGGEDKLSRQLTKLLGHVSIVILQVKRYPHHISGTEYADNKFFLKGQVSEKEAAGISMRFMDKCDNDTKKAALQELVEEVYQGQHHSVYEFGLTTFHKEYRGITSYIRGYLQLDANLTKSLEPGQEILGFLSMAYYYGQTSMPCQYFAAMLGKPSNYDVSFSDFPYFVQELIVPCEGRKNNIRICHYLIAEGILDQILTWPKQYEESPTETGLSVEAKSNLMKFAFKFIGESKKRTRSNGRANIIIETLTRTFLHRDYKDVGEGEISMRKRTLSTLIEDIPCNAPYTERIKIIQKLVSAFPENPNFHAHLGRIYTICQPDKEEIAKGCFEKALDLCQKETKGKVIDDINESMKITLMHIYHMFGMYYLNCVHKFTGRFGEKPVQRTTKDQYPARIEHIMELAACACKHFTKRREITPSGSEEGYGYISEITVRLVVCNFIYKNFPKGISNFGEFLKMADGTASGRFVMESIAEIAELFMECYSAVDASELPQEHYRNITMYNTLFNEPVPMIRYISKPGDIGARCFKAAAIKLKYGQDNNLGVLEKITNKGDIEELVKLYEECFEEIQKEGRIEKRRVLEMCYREWIHAIRHSIFPQNYKQDDVLLMVRHWNRFLRSPMSKFYLFCVLSVIGIGTNGAKGNVDHLQEAVEVREELQKTYFPKPRLPREWLGKGNGIKALVPVSEFFGHIEERNVKGESNTSRLDFLKGTICRPNRQRQTGFIDLDQGENLCRIKVFFVPIRTEGKLFGQTYAGERVEFALAFTTSNGYEAYNVSLLKKVLCTDCDSYVEIKSDEAYATCGSCNKRVFRE